MRLGRKRIPDVPDVPDVAEITERLGGPELVYDRGLLADWYIKLRLEQELARCQRYQHALAVVILAPQVLPGEEMPLVSLYAGAAVAKKLARETDLVGWLDKQDILVVLPDTDSAGAEAAAQRWRNEMWMRRTALGIVTWKTGAVGSVTAYTKVDEVISAAREDLKA